MMEISIYFIIIFTPWAFGTTENWSIKITEVVIFVTCLLMLCSCLIKFNITNKYKQEKIIYDRFFSASITTVTALIIIYTFICYVNARGDFNLETKVFTYFDYNKNFPTTYNQNATFATLLQHCSLIAFYYVLKHHLTSGMGRRKINRLIYLMAINAMVIVIIGITQRIFYNDQISSKLLFLITPEINKTVDGQFGPFAYRSNAGTLFNIIWPICLGLIFEHKYQYKKIGKGEIFFIYVSLFFCFLVPYITLARGAVFVNMVLILTIVMYISQSRVRRRAKYTLFSISIILLVIVVVFFWENNYNRISLMIVDRFSARIDLFKHTIEIAKDYYPFGSGPGSFEAIYFFELTDENNIWQSWAHNDFLEIFATYGVFGIVFITLLFALYILRIINLILRVKDHLLFFLFSSLIGLLIHSFGDFPLQVYSILIYMVLILGISFNYNKGY